MRPALSRRTTPHSRAAELVTVCRPALTLCGIVPDPEVDGGLLVTTGLVDKDGVVDDGVVDEGVVVDGVVEGTVVVVVVDGDVDSLTGWQPLFQIAMPAALQFSEKTLPR